MSGITENKGCFGGCGNNSSSLIILVIILCCVFGKNRGCGCGH